jgi:predicted metal-dependent HD superfamily phosphohydrolase
MPRMALKEEWHLLSARYSDDRTLREILWQELEASYTSEGRHYHNLQHLTELLSLAATHKALIANGDSVRFAIFYHDIVYNPLRKDNEEESAALAVKNLQLLGLQQQQLEHIRQMILATKTHSLSPDPDTNLLLDFDLSILGREWEIYYDYTRKIEKEHRLVPCFLYKKGRKKVLKHFLSLPAIYKTPTLYRQFEATARINLARELQLLNA